MKLVATLFLLLVSVPSFPQWLDQGDTLRTAKGEVYRFTIQLNEDSIPDYLELSYGNLPLRMKFFDGKSHAPIPMTNIPGPDKFPDADLRESPAYKPLPLGLKNVSAELKTVNINCEDGHEELIIRCKQPTVQEGYIYSMVVMRFDAASGKMKVVFMNWIEMIQVSSTLHTMRSYTDINHESRACIDSIVLKPAEVKTANQKSPKEMCYFDRQISSVDSINTITYRFDKGSNQFVVVGE